MSWNIKGFAYMSEKQNSYYILEAKNINPKVIHQIVEIFLMNFVLGKLNY